MGLIHPRVRWYRDTDEVTGAFMADAYVGENNLAHVREYPVPDLNDPHEGELFMGYHLFVDDQMGRTTSVFLGTIEGNNLPQDISENDALGMAENIFLGLLPGFGIEID